MRDAIEHLYLGHREFTAGPDLILEERGLNLVHHRILYFVGRNDRISVNSLLAILEISKQALNAPLRKLVQAGFISNEPAPLDRRVKQLRLTTNGKRLEQRLTDTQMRQLARVFDEAGSNAETGWRKVMARLRG